MPPEDTPMPITRKNEKPVVAHVGVDAQPAPAPDSLPDEIEIFDDPHDEFDPEGWMSEHPTYWTDLPDPEPPTRLAWLRHRLREAASYFGVAQSEPAPALRVSEEEWVRLSEMALGPLPRQGDFAQREEARPAAPDSRNTASKPAASSLTARRPRARTAV